MRTKQVNAFSAKITATGISIRYPRQLFLRQTINCDSKRFKDFKLRFQESLKIAHKLSIVKREFWRKWKIACKIFKQTSYPSGATQVLERTFDGNIIEDPDGLHSKGSQQLSEPLVYSACWLQGRIPFCTWRYGSDVRGCPIEYP